MSTLTQLSPHILEQAAEWFVEFRSEEPPLPARQEFLQWLRLSPQHIQAYMEVAQTYADLGAARDGLAPWLVELLADAPREGGADIVPLKK